MALAIRGYFRARNVFCFGVAIARASKLSYGRPSPEECRDNTMLARRQKDTSRRVGHVTKGTSQVRHYYSLHTLVQINLA